MKNIFLLVGILAAMQAVGQHKDYLISLEGLGALKLGISQAEVEKIAGKKIRLDNHLDTINDHSLDSAKFIYRNIPVQLEFDRNYTAPYTFHWRLIGIRASSPLCKTATGIGIGSNKLKVVAAYEDYPINIQSGYVHYYQTIKSKTKSTISISDDEHKYMIRLYLLNNKVVSFELKANIPDQLSLEAADEGE